MSISAAQVKELRESTGAGMMDCKKALTETDFVARNEGFQKLVRDIASVALSVGGELSAISAAAYPGKGNTVEDELRDAIATIGENMTLRRSAGLKVSDGVVASYMHNVVSDGLGKIGVLVAIESKGDKDALNAFGRQVAMHVAASKPLALTPEQIDPQVAERERAVYAEQARESGKPEAIIEKMVEGRMRKFYEESTLLKQPFVMDPDKTVEQAAKAAEAEVGAPLKIVAFERFALGEGVEKAEEGDFAAEVAAMAGKK